MDHLTIYTWKKATKRQHELQIKIDSHSTEEVYNKKFLLYT